MTDPEIWKAMSEVAARRIMKDHHIREDDEGMFLEAFAHAWRAGWLSGTDKYIRDSFAGLHSVKA